MDVAEIIGQARDTMSAKRVYAEPVERDGVIVIPAAVVRGGGGGGGGESQEGKGSGGGFFGMTARPAGSYVVDEGGVHWRPAIDWTAVLFGLEAIAIVGLLVYRSVETRRLRAG